MSLNFLKQEFKKNKVDKAHYIHQMHEYHKVLFDYADTLSHTDIVKIEILPSGVFFTAKPRGLDYPGDGIRFYVDPVDHRIAPLEIINFDSYENSDFSMIAKLIKPGETILDIGANIGFYSLSLAKKFPTSVFHAFEPMPKTFGQLKRNLEMNDLDNVHIYNCGCSDQKRELTFFFYPEGSGNASSAKLTDCESIEEITAPVITVDEFVAERNIKVNFMKCDVEGAELLVFKGAADTIKHQRPIVFSEILRKWTRKFDYDANEIFTFFAEAGYSAHVCVNNQLQPFSGMTEDTRETNFFFIPNASERR